MNIFVYQMKKKSCDEIEQFQTVSRISSVISLFIIFSTSCIYFYLTMQLNKTLDVKEQESVYKVLKMEIEDRLKLEGDQHIRFARQSWRPQSKWMNNVGFRRRNNMEEPRVCDCTVIDCPRGPRGPPGDDGNWPNDGLPGQPGKDGTDGIYQVDEPECPPCPRGPPGEDGEVGDPGEAGHPGRPGKPGEPGTNEPGSIGQPGSRGQSGRTGPKGATGDAGQDFVQLQGIPGPKGAPGPVGLHGTRGDPGSNGKPAPPGPPGYPGPVGEPGDQGDYGDRGLPGRKGAPGQDGGYCQCPPREGPIPSRQQNNRASTWSKANKPSDDIDYEEELSNSAKRNRVSERNWPNYKQSQSNRHIYQNSRKSSSNTDLIDVGQTTMRRSPLAPLIAYKDSREEGHSNRVIMHRSSAGSRGSDVDFELR